MTNTSGLRSRRASRDHISNSFWPHDDDSTKTANSAISTYVACVGTTKMACRLKEIKRGVAKKRKLEIG
jgi:hypothetical protein